MGDLWYSLSPRQADQGVARSGRGRLASRLPLSVVGGVFRLLSCLRNQLVERCPFQFHWHWLGSVDFSFYDSVVKYHDNNLSSQLGYQFLSNWSSGCHHHDQTKRFSYSDPPDFLTTSFQYQVPIYQGLKHASHHGGVLVKTGMLSAVV